MGILKRIGAPGKKINIGKSTEGKSGMVMKSGSIKRARAKVKVRGNTKIRLKIGVRSIFLASIRGDIIEMLTL
jgi:hypothetical protein